MLEKALIAAVNRQVPKHIFHQSMTGASRFSNGIPDRYYDGPRSDLWAEYKMLTSMPRSGLAVGAFKPLQILWMTRRWRNGHNVIGLVGLPNKRVCVQRTPEEWLTGTIVTLAISIKETACLITDFCGRSSEALAGC